MATTNLEFVATTNLEFVASTNLEFVATTNFLRGFVSLVVVTGRKFLLFLIVYEYFRCFWFRVPDFLTPEMGKILSPPRF